MMRVFSRKRRVLLGHCRNSFSRTHHKSSIATWNLRRLGQGNWGETSLPFAVTAKIPRNFVHSASNTAVFPRTFVHDFVHNAANDAIFPRNFVHSARKNAVTPRNFVHDAPRMLSFPVFLCSVTPKAAKQSSPFLSFYGSFLGRFWGMSSVFAVAHFWMDLFWRFVWIFCADLRESFFVAFGFCLSLLPPPSSSSSSGCRPGFSLLSSLPVSAGPPSPVDRQVRHCFCLFFLSVSSLCPGRPLPFLLPSSSSSFFLSLFLSSLSLSFACTCYIEIYFQQVHHPARSGWGISDQLHRAGERLLQLLGQRKS